ncbi:MAG: CAP domain-containing protein [Candidatus Nanopelagicales bacterium]
MSFRDHFSPRWTASVALVALVATGSPAQAAAPDSAAAAQAAAAAMAQAVAVPAGWTGSVAGCVLGSESAESLAATLRGVNLLRSAAGIGPVTFDPLRNQLALAAALIMRAQASLSHAPTSNWACFTPAGADAAGRSNLYLGLSGATAMLGYVLDDGVDSLGHRRWLLDPGATVFGSGSTGTSNALWVTPLGARAAVASGTQVAWPPAGYVPVSWLPKTWSLAIGGDGDVVTASNPVVTMTIGGRSVPVSTPRVLPDGYGCGVTISWQPAASVAELATGSKIEVTISGIQVNGVTVPITYAVNAVPATVASPSPTPTPTPTATTPTPTAGPTARVSVKAVKKATKLRVNVDPDLPGNWHFRVYRASLAGWIQVKSTHTTGKKDMRTLNLPKGLYQVVVEGRNGYAGVSSDWVTLRK